MTAGAARRAGQTLADRWVAPIDPRRLAVLRILVAGFATGFVAGRSIYLLDAMALPEGRWRPLGVLGPLDAPPPDALALVVVVLTVALGVATTVGWHHRCCGPGLAVSFLLVATYGSSWGQLFHTEHLLALHLGVVGLAPAADVWSLDARSRRRHARSVVAPQVDPYGWPVRLLSAITVATYVLAGVAKVRLGGTAWLHGQVLAHQVAFDNARKLMVGSVASPWAGWLVDQAWLWRPAAWAGLAVELGAPLALAFRRLRRWWAAAAWAFHVVIVAVMAIVFVYPLSGVAFASLFPVERPARRLALRCRSWSSRRAASSASASPPASWPHRSSFP